MAIHAATNHGVKVVGVTFSKEQYDWATKRVADLGLADRVELRIQDYRDIDDGPFDAISSIGMFEHVGRRRMVEYFSRLHALLRPGGRLLNHAIGRPGHKDSPGHGVASRRVAPADGGRCGVAWTFRESPALSWIATSFPTGNFTKWGAWSR